MPVNFIADDKLKGGSVISLSQQVARLKDSDRMAREDAAEVIIAGSDPNIARELCGLLADPDISVRNLVAEVLVNLGEKAAGALIDESQSNDHNVRKFVVDTMALIADRDFIPVLIRLLKDPNENVVGSAAEALGRIIDDNAIAPLIECVRDHPDSRLQAIEALGNIGSARALPLLSRANWG